MSLLNASILCYSEEGENYLGNVGFSLIKKYTTALTGRYYHHPTLKNSVITNQLYHEQ